MSRLEKALEDYIGIRRSLGSPLRQAIAICRNSVRARLPLAKQTINKERLKKRGKAGRNHRGTSRGISRWVAS